MAELEHREVPEPLRKHYLAPRALAQFVVFGLWATWLAIRHLLLPKRQHFIRLPAPTPRRLLRVAKQPLLTEFALDIREVPFLLRVRALVPLMSLDALIVALALVGVALLDALLVDIILVDVALVEVLVVDILLAEILLVVALRLFLVDLPRSIRVRLSLVVFLGSLLARRILRVVVVALLIAAPRLLLSSLVGLLEVPFLGVVDVVIPPPWSSQKLPVEI